MEATPASGELGSFNLNDVEMSVDEDRLEAVVRSVAEGNANKAGVAAFFREGKSP